MTDAFHPDLANANPNVQTHPNLRHVRAPELEAVVVLARSTQEAIVINLPSLRGAKAVGD